MKALEEYSSINGESLDNSRGPLTLELGDALEHDGEVYRLVRLAKNLLALLRESDSYIVASAPSEDAAITVDSIVQLVGALMMSDVDVIEVLGSWGVV